MAELADAVVLGTIRKYPVQVQVLLPVRVYSQADLNLRGRLKIT